MEISNCIGSSTKNYIIKELSAKHLIVLHPAAFLQAAQNSSKNDLADLPNVYEGLCHLAQSQNMLLANNI